MGPRDEAPSGRNTAASVAMLAFPATSLLLSAMLYGYRFSDGALRSFALVLTLLTTVAFAAGIVAALRASGGSGERAIADGPGWIPRVLPAAVTSTFAAMYHHLMLGGPYFSRVTLGLSTVAVVLAVIAIRARAALAWLVASLVAVLVVNTIVLLPRIPLLESGGDMLNLIVGGVDRALAGENPYEDLRVPNGDPLRYSARPLTYLPFLWLSYLPPRAAGWDIRWSTIVSLLLTAWLFVRTARTGTGGAVTHGMATALAAVIVTPLVLVRAASIQTPLWWALLMTLCLLLSRRARPWALGTVLGLIGLTRESAVVLVPIFAAGIWRLRGKRGLATFLGVAAAVVACGIGPFLIADPAAFLSSMTYNVAHAGRHELDLGIPLAHVGFGGWLLRAGAGSFAILLQAAAVGVAMWYSWRRVRSLSRLFLVAGAEYFAFMLCNPVIHEYYYVPALLLVGLGLVMPPVEWSDIGDVRR